MPTLRVPPVKEIEGLGTGLWELRWFGPVIRNAEVPSEPRILVHFSPVVTGIAPHLQAPSRDCRIGVGQLPFLLIGSQWQDGEMKSRCSLRLPLVSLKVDTTSAESVHTGVKTADHFVIPRTHFQLGSHIHARSWCIAIPRGSDPYSVLIPAPEVIRFYYATSSVMARALFAGAFFAENIQWLLNPKSYFDRKGRIAAVRLRMKVPNADAPTIARILMDDQASEGARMIHRSLQMPGEGESRFASTCLPFSGTSTLKCHALSYRSAPNGPDRHLVLQIVSCDGPFPFDRLIRSRDNSGNQVEGEWSADSPRAPAWLKKGTQDIETLLKLQSKSEPVKGASAQQIEIANDRFLALQDMKIADDLPTFNRYRSAAALSIEEGYAALLGTGDGTWGHSTVRPALVKLESPKTRRPTLGPGEVLMREIAENLSTIDGYFARMRPSFESGVCVPADPAKGPRQWAYRDPDASLLRYCYCLDIVCQHHWFVALDADRRPRNDAHCLQLIGRRNGQPLSDDDVLLLVARLTAARWIADGIPKDDQLRIRSMSHKSPTGKEFAYRIARATRAMLPVP